MTHSTRWSNVSAPCRLEWRPSRWAVAALLGLAVLAPCAVLGSEMPPVLAAPSAAVAFGYGLWLARRQASARPRQLVWPSGIEPVTIDGEEAGQAWLHWRGPLAFLCWRDRSGQVQRLVWWPDRLSPAQRRELKLAAQTRAAAPAPASMAP